MPNGTWTSVATSGNWSNTGNWASLIPADGATFTANFTSNITATTTVTVDTPRIIGNLVFSDNALSGSDWVISRSSTNTLTLDNGASAPVITTTTTASINAPLITSNGFTKNGAGILFFTGDAANTAQVSGTINITAGDVAVQLTGATQNAFPLSPSWVVASGRYCYPRPATANAVLTLNGTFSGAGTLSHQNDLAATTNTVVNGSVSGLAFVRVYAGGSISVPDLPAIAFQNDTASSEASIFANLSSVAFPTPPSSAVYFSVNSLTAGTPSSHTFSSNGTQSFSTTGNIRRVDTGTQNITLKLAGAAGMTITGNATNSSTSGLINLQKTDAGTVVLRGDNSLFRNNSVTISAGALRAENALALGNTTGTVTVSTGAAFELANNITFTKPLNINGTLRSVSGTNTITSSTTLAGSTTVEAQAGTLTFSPSSLTGAQALTAGGAGTVSVTPVLSTITSLTKIGTGPLTLNASNSFTGVFNIADGAVMELSSLAASGVASAIGAGSVVGLSGSGTLRYTGSTGAVLSRTVTGTSLTGGGFENTGSGNLVITAGTLSGTIELGGASDGTGQYNTLSATISSGGFTKSGPGRWIVTSINNLSGDTTVSGGTLMAAPPSIDTSAKLLGGNVTVAAGARIQLSSDSNQKGRNRYNNLTFAGAVGNPARIRVGGSAINPTVQMSGDLTISGAVTWNLTADTFKTPGTYRLVEFLSGQLTGGASALNNVTLQLPTGRSLAPSGLVYDGVSSPKTITVTII